MCGSYSRETDKDDHYPQAPPLPRRNYVTSMKIVVADKLNRFAMINNNENQAKSTRCLQPK